MWAAIAWTNRSDIVGSTCWNEFNALHYFLVRTDYTPRFNEVERGVYWYHLVRLTGPSVRLWTESCPLCIFNNTHRIHFIFAHLIKQLKKVCRVYARFKIFKNLKFWRFFLICNFDFVFFWLGIQYDSMVWVIMRRRRVSSERRRSSCSSWQLPT